MPKDIAVDEYKDWMKRVEDHPTTPRGLLDDWKCPNPDCTCADQGRMLVARCHTNASVVATYIKDGGKLVLCCGECGLPFMALRIAADA